MTIDEQRPTRPCDVCHQEDDHPRHTHDGNGVTTIRHMDCCRDAGCPDGSCYKVTQGAENLRGAELVAHLTRETA